MTTSEARRAIDAVWRIESARVIGALTRMVGDVGRAEDFAQDALVAALEKWPEQGVPDEPGAWLMTVAGCGSPSRCSRATSWPRDSTPCWR